MPLRTTLENILNSVDGALSVMVMGYDGIAIDEVAKECEEIDMQLLAVEYATVLKEIKRAVEVIKSGDLEEVSIATATTNSVIRVINNDFFIILIMSNDGNFGKGRFKLRVAAPDMALGLS